MAWTTPLTAVSNTALTAAQWNASVRDDLLETGPAKVTAAGQVLVATGANALAARVPQAATVATLETTTATSYADLTTVGPSVTAVTGASALVFIRSDIVNSTANASVASFAVSSATTIAASDTNAIGPDGSSKVRAGAMIFLPGSLTPGNNVFTMKYRVTGTTGTFANRQIAVFPL